MIADTQSNIFVININRPKNDEIRNPNIKNSLKKYKHLCKIYSDSKTAVVFTLHKRLHLYFQITDKIQQNIFSAIVKNSKTIFWDFFENNLDKEKNILKSKNLVISPFKRYNSKIDYMIRYKWKCGGALNNKTIIKKIFN